MYVTMKQERFSLAYLNAIAAKAGVKLVEESVDNDSVDGIFRADWGLRPQIDFQAKCHGHADWQEGQISLSYTLSLKNYDDLRIPTTNPRLLIVLLVPTEEHLWLVHTEDELSLKRCAYWTSLLGLPDATTAGTKNVTLPRANLLTPDTLLGLLERVNAGETL